MTVFHSLDFYRNIFQPVIEKNRSLHHISIKFLGPMSHTPDPTLIYWQLEWAVPVPVYNGPPQAIA